jgi:hypothetical protein
MCGQKEWFFNLFEGIGFFQLLIESLKWQKRIMLPEYGKMRKPDIEVQVCAIFTH